MSCRHGTGILSHFSGVGAGSVGGVAVEKAAGTVSCAGLARLI